MVLKNRPSVKKYKVSELKAIIRKYKIGKVGGRKAELVERIVSSDKWNEIRTNESLPEKKKRVFSKKQIEAQQRFKKKVINRIEEDSDITMEDIRDEIKDIPKKFNLIKKVKIQKKIDNIKIQPLKIKECIRCEILEELVMLMV